jgi:hypothetical protein
MMLLFISHTLSLLLGYLDPGTGSLILQLLLGGVAGFWVVLKLFGQRIKALFGFSKKEEETDRPS